jgi:hypothetical protein
MSPFNIVHETIVAAGAQGLVQNPGPGIKML